MNSSISKNTLWFLAVILSFGIGFGVNNYIANQYFEEIYTTDGLNLTMLAELWTQIKANYLDVDEIDKQELIYGAAAGMVEALGDPYTSFFDPEESEAFREDLDGFFEGVGIQMGVKDSQIVVVAPLKDTPAFNAGIKPGDVIVKVDDTFVNDLSIDSVINMIRGEKGTKVVLTVSRDGEEKTFEIIRGEIKIPTIQLSTLYAGEEKVAYLQMFHFSTQVYEDFKVEANNILNGDYEGIIIDLRGNPGGLVDETEKIAGWFLEEGSVILINEERDGTRTESISEGPGTLGHYPIVILVNEGTASAAEILAGALKDNLSCSIVGHQSFGKGLVQKVGTLNDGSILKITVSRWYTPSGNLINEVGIAPDYIEDYTEEDSNAGEDPQLEKALLVIEENI